jgi:predicted ATPase
MQEFHANGARFVDLSPITEPRLVPTALASALGLAIASDDPTQSIVQFLSRRDMLIVLDTCEHVIEAAAILADALLKGTSGIHILATSREPLRANGEWVKRLPPLAVPEQSSDLDANAVLGSPAVELFMERARASVDAFSLTERDVPLVAELCRRLDGLPLALALAAGRVEQFGLAGLLARLDDRFTLLKEDVQTAQPRHRTLRAMLDWSYDILSEQEQVVLRGVAPFKGEFTCESAAALIGRSDFGVSDVVECLASLAAKSLVAVNVSGEAATYKLPDVNRAYALDKLSEQ